MAWETTPYTTLAGNTAGQSVLRPSVFVGGSNVTLSGTGRSVVFIGGAGAPGGGGIAAAAGTQTATSGTVVWAGSNGVTFGMDGQTVTASVRTDYQSSGDYLTTAALSNHTHSQYAGTAGAITGGSITVNTSGVSVALPAYLTTAQPPGAYLTTAALSNHSHGNPSLALTNLSGTTASNSAGLTLSLSAAAPGGGAAQTFSAGTASGAPNPIVFSNSNGVSFGLNASTITATVRTDYQSAGAYLTTARASNDAIGLNTAATQVTWTVNSSGISLNAGAYLTTAAPSNHSHGNPTLALTNLSGTTASASNGLTISLSAAAPGAGGGIVVAAGANSITSGTALFSNANGVSFGFNGQTITASVNAGVGAAINRSFHEIMDGERLTTVLPFTGASFSKRPVLVPFWMDGADLGLGTVRVYFSRAAGTSLNATLGIAFYSMNNSTSITRFASTSHAVSLTTSAQWSGVRAFDFTGMGASSLSEGRWVMGLFVSASNNSTAVGNIVALGGDALPVGGFIFPGTNSTGATASQSRHFPFWGVYSATTAAFPDGIGLSQVQGGNSAQAADVYAAIYEGTI